jgi:hypothetical protein
MGNKYTTWSDLRSAFEKCEGNRLLIKTKYGINCSNWGKGDKCKGGINSNLFN